MESSVLYMYLTTSFYGQFVTSPILVSMVSSKSICPHLAHEAINEQGMFLLLQTHYGNVVRLVMYCMCIPVVSMMPSL